MKKITLITILFIGSLSFGQITNLIINGGFEDGIETGWGNAAAGADNSYNTASVIAGAAFNSFNISSLAVPEGGRAGQLKTGGSALRQVVAVSPGTYVVQFWFAGSNPAIVAPATITNWTGDVQGDNLILTPVVPDSGANINNNTEYGCQVTLDDGSLSSWKEAKFTFNVDETITKVRLTYFLAGGSEIQFLDKVSIVLDNKASVDDFAKLHFTVYPNPAQDIIYVNSLSSIKEAEIYDITGKLIMRSNKIGDNTLDISNLDNGIYMLKIQDINQNLGTRKLVVSR